MKCNLVFVASEKNFTVCDPLRANIPYSAGTIGQFGESATKVGDIVQIGEDQYKLRFRVYSNNFTWSVLDGREVINGIGVAKSKFSKYYHGFVKLHFAQFENLPLETTQ